MSKNTIELNGRQYDALSGRLLHDVASARPHHTAAAPKAPPAHRGRTIDGVLSNGSKLVRTPKLPMQKAVARAAKSPKQPAAHVRAHQPKPTQTLMRHTVHKPGPLHIKAQTHAQLPIHKTAAVSTSSHLTRKHQDITTARIERAHQVPAHDMVQRFGHAKPRPKLVPKIEPITVQAAPLSFSKSNATHTAPPTNMFEKALANATSHKAPHRAHAKTRRAGRGSSRLVGVLSITGAFLLLVGFVAYLNMPQISVALASSHAGFTATAPAYKPPGFSFNSHVYAQTGQVIMKFQSRTDPSRAFAITQQASNWDSQTLQDSLASNSKPFTTVSDSGRRIYVSPNNTAMWVNGGILYKLTGDADLSSHQLASIASSM